jgi:hypothetical protein
MLRLLGGERVTMMVMAMVDVGERCEKTSLLIICLIL